MHGSGIKKFDRFPRSIPNEAAEMRKRRASSIYVSYEFGIIKRPCSPTCLQANRLVYVGGLSRSFDTAGRLEKIHGDKNRFFKVQIHYFLEARPRTCSI